MKRILAVDNDPLVLSFLDAALRSMGHRVDTAGNGREALEKIDRERYDLVISDLRMPELDGLGLCRVLQARRADTVPRLLFLTTPDAREDHRVSLRDVMVPALTKPVSLDELRHAVERMLASAGSREAEMPVALRS